MHNIYELEKKWLNYKIKYYLPHTAAVITVILLSIYTFNAVEIPTIKDEQVTFKEKIIAQVTTQKQEPEEKPVEPKKKPVEAKIELDNKNENKILTLNPSLDFMKNLSTNSVNTYEQKIEKESVPRYSPQKNIQAETEIEIEIEVEKKLATISLVKQETVDDINHVIKRFNKNNNPALSLFVAKKYYKLKDYHKAYNYALITNNINKDIDESWILFSKSLVKLNKKELAIKTLIKYIEQSSSINAKVLLDNIKSGKFK